MKQYIRDGRAPIPEKESTSKVMSANKAKDTSPEIALRKQLVKVGLTGYRLHQKHVVGKPDIAFNKVKLAIFVHGCFWHRCPYCSLSLPKANTGFWQKKFEANIARDIKKRNLLESEGWTVLTIWECEIKSDIGSTVLQKIATTHSNLTNQLKA